MRLCRSGSDAVSNVGDEREELDSTIDAWTVETRLMP